MSDAPRQAARPEPVPTAPTAASPSTGGPAAESARGPAPQPTEAALREVEDRYRLLVGQALTGIVVVQDGRVSYANDRFLALLGLDRDALASRPRVLELTGRRVTPALRRLRDALAGGGPGRDPAVNDARAHAGVPEGAREVLTARHRDGSEVVLDVSASAAEFEGRPGFLCTVSDLTHERRLQARMIEAEKVESVSLLASGVAHDFNNLLGSILAWVDLARAEFGPESPARVPLEEIRAAAARATDLTRQLLAFTRQQRLAPEPVDLAGVVQRLQLWLGRVLEPRHSLQVQVPDARWMVLADRTELERAFASLVMNARDALPNGGVVRIAVTLETLGADRAEAIGPLSAGDHVVVTVSDDGIGMDSATRRRIFDPFFTTKPQGQGTGLGLPAVLGTLLQSGGGIEVRSAPGRGSAFRCYLPRLAGAEVVPGVADARPDAAPVPGTERAGPLRVLVVEDDPDLAGVLMRTLAHGGHDVRLASSPAEARTMAEARPVDVLVCDLGLPGMNGATLAGELSAGGRTQGVVLISGRDISEEERLEASPAALVLQKPFRRDEIDAAVRASVAHLGAAPRRH